MTAGPLAHLDVVRLLLPGGTKFPPRPDARVLSEAIPLFFIGRNKNRLWVAREAAGRMGGVFLFKRSALRFAAKHSASVGGATMLLGERCELDVENRGGTLVAGLDAVMRAAARIAPLLRRRIFLPAVAPGNGPGSMRRLPRRLGRRP